ncbi:AGR235Wp [Eremothecium gossypii ATCC 10895]|uniref:AGR235Wp n=1 Tax=Eremothecium gossypii (strain ATCC 10895 / CBS 109.51 / FGSC 9923 / NRRL Y-1056) TaxID=284811 RepID=Q74ZH2_EREGS|nr:AGR235Wp [Eremothecium gossypii ATCC 10895]AAS54725.2 AGR235Wp [Eremothecium gossypii ATCC 10895]AEY99056.1 FAGR235Wp [Eremothecium gossypii FDAG1]
MLRTQAYADLHHAEGKDMSFDSKREVENEKEPVSTKEATEPCSDLDAIKSHEVHAFSDPAIAEYYRREYDKVQYECRQFFDPTLTWTKEEERQVLRKLDIHIVGLIVIVYFACQLDYGSLGQATADNMLNELHMDTNQYNLGNQLSIFVALAFELPMQLVIRRYGADKAIPYQMLIWGAIVLCQAGMKNCYGFYATRVLSGIAAAGLLTTVTVWLTYFYTSGELAFRTAFLFATSTMDQVFSALIAYGVLRLRGVCNLSGWQWLFIVEGIITFSAGLYVCFTMVPSIAQTKGVMYPKGWLSERQQLIAVNRLLRDDPSKGTMNNRQGITIREFLRSLSDYDFWPLYAISLIVSIPEAAVVPYLPLNLRSLGFSSLKVQILIIPAFFIHAISMLIFTKLSDVWDERALMEIFPLIWKGITLGCLRWWSGSFVDKWGTYALLITLRAVPSYSPIYTGWSSKNANSVRTRAVAAAAGQFFNKIGYILANQTYRKDDAPAYHRGNLLLFCINLITIPLMIGSKLYFVWRNKRRDELWNKMTEKERQHYTLTTTDQGNKRLDFRFAH